VINRVERLIINLDTQMPLSCAWDDCPKRARTPYQVRVHEHADEYKCDDPVSRHAHYAFCSEKCKMYWLNATGANAHDSAYRNRGQIYGMLPAGMKRATG
jgi:hypothetical protein